MHTTVNIDDELLARATRVVGAMGLAARVSEGLRVCIAGESAKRLAVAPRVIDVSKMTWCGQSRGGFCPGHGQQLRLASSLVRRHISQIRP